MSRRRATLLAGGLWCATLAAGIASLVLAVVTDLPEASGRSSWSLWAISLAATQGFVVVGVVIVSRRPQNPIGWIFCVAPLVCQLAILAETWSYFADERDLAGVAWTAVAAPTGWVIGVGLVAVYGFLLFPDGRLPSARWRRLAWGSAALLAVYAIATATVPGEIPRPEGYDNPMGVPGMDVVRTASVVLFLGLIAAALASLVVRFRAASGDERQQLRIVAATVCFGLTGIALFELLVLATGGRAAGDEEAVRYTVWLAAALLIPISVGVAILRYRLYDVERVISRTIVYAALTLILGAAYAGLVLAGQALFSTFAGGSNLAIAVSTLVVAALFLPVRRRVQGFVDRRFYRRRYDAQRTLDAFGARLRRELDLEALVGDLSGVVDETMRPAHVSLWLREVERP